jgi:ribosomal protein S18 acetylase RimI-like enzyme
MSEYNIIISPLTKKHLSDVKNVNNICFQDAYQEDISVYNAIIEVFPEGAYGAFCDNELVGYIFFHPYKYPAVKPLNSLLALSGDENCMYLHEIAVLPEYRAQHIPTRLLSAFDHVSQSHNLTLQSLVSVQNSIGFWEKKGFAVVREVNEGGYKDSYLMDKQL